MNSDTELEQMINRFELKVLNSVGMSREIEFRQSMKINILDSLRELVETEKKKAVEEANDFDYEEYERKTAEVAEAVRNKEVIYISSRDGHAVTEEQYFEFMDYVDSVGKPEGSTVEQFIKVDLSTQKNVEGREIVCNTKQPA